MYISSSWSLNASLDKSYNVFVASSGYVTYRSASNKDYIRPVVNINGSVSYKKGTGTADDPYIIGN